MFRDRNPNFLFLFSRELRCMVFLGPHRTWAAMKAGCAEMAVWLTRSSIVGVVAVGARGAGRVMELRERLGRRVGREVKVLCALDTVVRG